MANAPAATARRVDRPADAPWTQRWIQRAPVAPAWFGLGFALVLWALRVAWLAVFEGHADQLLEPGFWVAGSVPAAAVLALIAGYAPAATAYSLRAQQRTLERLEPLLGGDAARLLKLRGQLVGFDMQPLRVIGVLAAAGSAAVLLFEPGLPPEPRRGGLELAGVLWINLIPAWLVARTLAHEVRAARLFSRLGHHHVRVDLWDLRPLVPFVHRGLQAVLLWSLGMAIATLMYVVSAWSGPVELSGAILVGVAVALVVLPAYGVHRNIVETKQAQLDHLHAELRAREADLLAREGSVAAEAAARLPALLALREHVRSVREWPFDVPSLVRFGLYVLIGLGSWLGAALVERLLGWLLP